MKHTTLKHTGQSTQNTCNEILILHSDSYYRHFLLPSRWIPFCPLWRGVITFPTFLRFQVSRKEGEI
jgi:hypothetical protein